MSDLVAFLRARLDEDERAARNTPAPDWQVAPDNRHHVQVVPAEDATGPSLVIAYIVGGEAPHIARHDPARVLREVEAKRAVLAETIEPFLHRRGEDYVGNNAWLAARLLALPYADHPGYRDEWRV